jgi:hypothetical protein
MVADPWREKTFAGGFVSALAAVGAERQRASRTHSFFMAIPGRVHALGELNARSGGLPSPKVTGEVVRGGQ